MEIKKEDLVKFKIVNTSFYAFPTSIMDKEEIPESVPEVDVELELQKEKDAKLIEEMKLEKADEEAKQLAKQMLHEAKRKADIIKADKKAKLIAELAALEE